MTSQTSSGSNTEREWFLLLRSSWTTIQAGIPQQENILELLGRPTDLQVLSTLDGLHELWAYVVTNKARQPIQHLLFFQNLSTLKPRRSIISFAQRAL